MYNNSCRHPKLNGPIRSQYSLACPRILQLTMDVEQAIRNCFQIELKQRDVFVALPTGYGKSLIYSVLPWMFNLKKQVNQDEIYSMIIVVSPLESLMKDQVQSLCKLGITATYVGSSVKRESILKGEYDMSRNALQNLVMHKRMKYGKYLFKNGCPSYFDKNEERVK